MRGVKLSCLLSEKHLTNAREDANSCSDAFSCLLEVSTQDQGRRIECYLPVKVEMIGPGAENTRHVNSRTAILTYLSSGMIVTGLAFQCLKLPLSMCLPSGPI
eukprot:756299-Hanusia_phi.AAC.5